MKRLSFIPLILFSILLYGQDFAPDGAIWYYTYDPDITLDDGYQKIEVSGDTLIHNKTCKILQKTNIGYSHWHQEYYELDAGKNYIYEKDSVVYFLRDSSFHILYDFSAKAGDSYYSMSLKSTCTDSFLVTIDSVTSTTFDNQILRKYHFDDYYFLEKIGYPIYMFRFQIPCEQITGPHYPGPLRCYNDNEFGTLSTDIVATCDYITSSNQIKANNQFIKIYPNPASRQDCINIDVLDKNPVKIEIYSSLGHIIKSHQIKETKNITISMENAGNYIVCAKDKNDIVIYRVKMIIK